MTVTTSTWIEAPPEVVWPLLTGSRMDLDGVFCLGVPKPVACELPEGEGGVGSERRCISDRGTVVQRITGWTPPAELKFEMVSTDHGWGKTVESIREHFTLEDRNGRTRITRRTSLRAKGRWLAWVKEMCFCVGLKRVHLYVFRNWKKAACAV